MMWRIFHGFPWGKSHDFTRFSGDFHVISWGFTGGVVGIFMGISMRFHGDLLGML
jgi:hypothetical protein